MAANSMRAARSVPLIASVPKMLFPFLVILPGLIALALTSPVTQNAASDDQPIQSPQAVEIQSAQKGMIPPQTNPETGEVVKDKSGKVVLDYNMVIPNMLLHYFPSGMLGLGLTALLASFMSGMAGNVTAFNTVWTYDIFKAYIRRDATDENLLIVGQLATFFGVAFSVAIAYFVAAFNNIMDVLQLVFAFVNAPLFATFLLGMFWKRATGHGAFFGLLCGTVAAAVHHGLTISSGSTPGIKGAWIATAHVYPKSDGAEFLHCDLCLDRLLPDHDRDKPFHQTASRRRAERLGLCTDRKSARKGWPLVLATSSSRHCRANINPHS